MAHWIEKGMLAVLGVAVFTSACAKEGSESGPAEQAYYSQIGVENNVVTSAHSPALKIKIDPAFDYLGRHDIRIRDVAAGERLVFADIDGDDAARMIILQFEGFNDGVEGAYRYDLSNSPDVAGYKWRSNPYAFNIKESIKNNPGAEPDSTAQFLTRKSVAYPDDWMMWRSLTITTDDAKNELIIFYVEDLASTGKRLDDIYDADGENTDYWRSLMPDLERRANASFQLSPLEREDWQAIPRYFDSME